MTPPATAHHPTYTASVSSEATRFVDELTASATHGSSTLPYLPAIVIRIQKALADPRVDHASVVAFVRCEPLLAARVIALASVSGLTPPLQPPRCSSCRVRPNCLQPGSGVTIELSASESLGCAVSHYLRTGGRPWRRCVGAGALSRNCVGDCLMSIRPDSPWCSATLDVSPLICRAWATQLLPMWSENVRLRLSGGRYPCHIGDI
jgi:hypothetical protein